jgi:hypothetical protein
MFKKAFGLKQIGVIDDDDDHDHANTSIVPNEGDDCGIGRVAQLAASSTESEGMSVSCSECNSNEEEETA